VVLGEGYGGIELVVLSLFIERDSENRKASDYTVSLVNFHVQRRDIIRVRGLTLSWEFQHVQI
jgi:hypothetical protein